jgi:hypothetical protein
MDSELTRGDMLVREHTTCERASVVMIVLSLWKNHDGATYRLGKEGWLGVRTRRLHESALWTVTD